MTEATPYAPGTEVEIDEVDGVLYIKTTTEVVDDLVVE
jgi:hypothetical protein